MKDIILEYILNLFRRDPDNMVHNSSCYFPFEPCSCKTVDNLTYDTPLISGGILDSFSMVSVLVFIENTFDVKIPFNEAIPENFDSINKICKLIEKNKKITL